MSEPTAGRRGRGTQGPSDALQDPRHEIFAIEKSAGVAEELALKVAGVGCVLPREPGEFGGLRRSRIARQALARLDVRIRVLALLGRELEGHDRLRHLRAIAELRWARAILEGGGIEPSEWQEQEAAGGEPAEVL